MAWRRISERILIRFTGAYMRHYRGDELNKLYCRHGENEIWHAYKWPRTKQWKEWQCPLFVPYTQLKTIQKAPNWGIGLGAFSGYAINAIFLVIHHRHHCIYGHQYQLFPGSLVENWEIMIVQPQQTQHDKEMHYIHFRHLSSCLCDIWFLKHSVQLISLWADIIKYSNISTNNPVTLSGIASLLYILNLFPGNNGTIKRNITPNDHIATYLSLSFVIWNKWFTKIKFQASI